MAGGNVTGPLTSQRWNPSSRPVQSSALKFSVHLLVSTTRLAEVRYDSSSGRSPYTLPGPMSNNGFCCTRFAFYLNPAHLESFASVNAAVPQSCVLCPVSLCLVGTTLFVPFISQHRRSCTERTMLLSSSIRKVSRRFHGQERSPNQVPEPTFLVLSLWRGTLEGNPGDGRGGLTVDRCQASFYLDRRPGSSRMFYSPLGR